MLTHQIALVSKTRHVKTGDLTKVAAALQKQATRDLGPIWEIQATVDAFELLTAMYAAQGHKLRDDWLGTDAM